MTVTEALGDCPMAQQERDHVRHIVSLARAARTYLKIAAGKNDAIAYDSLDNTLKDIESFAHHVLAATLLCSPRRA